jgi:hypothetical protein
MTIIIKVVMVYIMLFITFNIVCKKTKLYVNYSINTSCRILNFSLVLKIIASPKKSLKIPKRQSVSVIRRTDNTMAKRKRTK